MPSQQVPGVKRSRLGGDAPDFETLAKMGDSCALDGPSSERLREELIYKFPGSAYHARRHAERLASYLAACFRTGGTASH